MQFAIDILEEQLCSLRAHMRECGRMEDRVCAKVGDFAGDTLKMSELTNALRMLRGCATGRYGLCYIDPPEEADLGTARQAKDNMTILESGV